MSVFQHYLSNLQVAANLCPNKIYKMPETEMHELSSTLMYKCSVLRISSHTIHMKQQTPHKSYKTQLINNGCMTVKLIPVALCSVEA